MNPTSLPPATRRPACRLWLWGLLATPVLVLLLLGAGVASFFHLGYDARVLRNALIESSGVEWRQQIALNVDFFTLGAVRAGLSCLKLDPGARAALHSVRAATVGIYRPTSGTPQPDRAAMLSTADSAMKARGWGRVAGVMNRHDLVAVYVPENDISARCVRCCVMVFSEKEMVLASARGNLEPLLKFAFTQRGFAAQLQNLAKR
jgi:hypothetical protein